MTGPDLFPRPREIAGFDPHQRFSGHVQQTQDTSLPPQGYVIDITTQHAHLAWADELGRRYGESTLEQLRAGSAHLPQIHIEDHPDFVTRGFMLDVSRDRVPTRDTLEHLVTRLATCRYNQFQLYIEHTFAHPAHRDVWEHASPITPDDLRWLDGLCQDAGIDLVVNQNTFGHFGRWLAHDTYRHRAECPDGCEVIDGFRLPPTVLAPTPSNAEFALDLVRTQLACVTSRHVNIGCDETFELGQGVSAPRIATEGIGAVYAEYLHRIADPLLADGYSVQFWADVVRTHPEILDSLPAQQCTPIVWNYDAPNITNPTLPREFTQILNRIGIDLDAPTDFATICEPFANADRPFWVAPGTSTWQSLVGRWPNSKANLFDAAKSGHAAGATGYLVTDWGDSGHLQPPSVSLLPIVYGGALSWCSNTNHSVDPASVVSSRLVDDAANLFGMALATIGSVNDAIGVIARNAGPLFQAVAPSPTVLSSGEIDIDATRDVIALLDTTRNNLGRARLICADGNQLVTETEVAIGLARHGAKRMLKRVGEPWDASEQAADLGQLIKQYRAAWLGSSRPGGLNDSVAGLEATRSHYLSR